VNILQSIIIAAPWLLWLAYWLATSQSVNSTAPKETQRSRTLQTIPLIAGAALLLLPDPTLSALTFDWSRIGTMQFAGFAILEAGLLLSVWAHLYLGMNRGVSATFEQQHEVIRSGPYALVRHPIYTGFLAALAGTALIADEWRGALGVALIFVSLAYKVRLKERARASHFGDEYARYRSEVAALIPGIY
jgi:protein-S-isoprenylcysteine O-methyltransferase Ste14